MEGINGDSTYEEIGDAWVHGMARQLRDKYYPHCDIMTTQEGGFTFFFTI